KCSRDLRLVDWRLGHWGISPVTRHLVHLRTASRLLLTAYHFRLPSIVPIHAAYNIARTLHKHPTALGAWLSEWFIPRNKITVGIARTSVKGATLFRFALAHFTLLAFRAAHT